MPVSLYLIILTTHPAFLENNQRRTARLKLETMQNGTKATPSGYQLAVVQMFWSVFLLTGSNSDPVPLLPQ